MAEAELDFFCGDFSLFSEEEPVLNRRSEVNRTAKKKERRLRAEREKAEQALMCEEQENGGEQPAGDEQGRGAPPTCTRGAPPIDAAGLAGERCFGPKNNEEAGAVGSSPAKKWYNLVEETRCAERFYFPHEIEEGNIEYKRMLVSCAPQRLQQLTTQMQFRLREGQGFCLYRVGVDDNGWTRGITDLEMEESLRNLYACAATIDPAIEMETSVTSFPQSRGQLSRGQLVKIAEVTFRIPTESDDEHVHYGSVASSSTAGVKIKEPQAAVGSTQSSRVGRVTPAAASGGLTQIARPPRSARSPGGLMTHDLNAGQAGPCRGSTRETTAAKANLRSRQQVRSRVVFCGPSGGGKSSLIGCLTTELNADNGDGLARSLVLQFPHEVLSGGVTSSITKTQLRSRVVDKVKLAGAVKAAGGGVAGEGNRTAAEQEELHLQPSESKPNLAQIDAEHAAAAGELVRGGEVMAESARATPPTQTHQQPSSSSTSAPTTISATCPTSTAAIVKRAAAATYNNYNKYNITELVDVPGDCRYLKTTLRGILGCNNFTPLVLVWDGRKPFTEEFKAYVELARSLERRLVVLLTKCDSYLEGGDHKNENLEGGEQEPGGGKTMIASSTNLPESHSGKINCRIKPGTRSDAGVDLSSKMKARSYGAPSAAGFDSFDPPTRAGAKQKEEDDMIRDDGELFFGALFGGPTGEHESLTRIEAKQQKRQLMRDMQLRAGEKKFGAAPAGEKNSAQRPSKSPTTPTPSADDDECRTPAKTTCSKEGLLRGEPESWAELSRRARKRARRERAEILAAEKRARRVNVYGFAPPLPGRGSCKKRKEDADSDFYNFSDEEEGEEAHAVVEGAAAGAGAGSSCAQIPSQPSTTMSTPLPPGATGRTSSGSASSVSMHAKDEVDDLVGSNTPPNWRGEERRHRGRRAGLLSKQNSSCSAKGAEAEGAEVADGDEDDDEEEDDESHSDDEEDEDESPLAVPRKSRRQRGRHAKELTFASSVTPMKAKAVVPPASSAVVSLSDSLPLAPVSASSIEAADQKAKWNEHDRSENNDQQRGRSNSISSQASEVMRERYSWLEQKRARKEVWTKKILGGRNADENTAERLENGSAGGTSPLRFGAEQRHLVDFGRDGELHRDGDRIVGSKVAAVAPPQTSARATASPTASSSRHPPSAYPWPSIKSNCVVEESSLFRRNFTETAYFEKNFTLVTKEKDVNLFLRKKPSSTCSASSSTFSGRKIPVLAVSCVTRYNFGLLEFLLANFFTVQPSFLGFHGVKFVVDYVCKADPITGGKTAASLVQGGMKHACSSKDSDVVLSSREYASMDDEAVAAGRAARVTRTLQQRQGAKEMKHLAKNHAYTIIVGGNTVTPLHRGDRFLLGPVSESHGGGASLDRRHLQLHHANRERQSLRACSPISSGVECGGGATRQLRSRSSPPGKQQNRSAAQGALRSSMKETTKESDAASPTSTSTARRVGGNANRNAAAKTTSSSGKIKGNASGPRSCRTGMPSTQTQWLVEVVSIRTLNRETVSCMPRGQSCTVQLRVLASSAADSTTGGSLAAALAAAGVSSSLTSIDENRGKVAPPVAMQVSIDIADESKQKLPGLPFSASNAQVSTTAGETSESDNNIRAKRQRCYSGTTSAAHGDHNHQPASTLAGTSTSDSVDGALVHRGQQLKVRPGVWLYEPGSTIPNHLKRYCLVRLRLLSGVDVAPENQSGGIVAASTPAPAIQKDDHLLLYLHSSRQSARIAWATRINHSCAAGGPPPPFESTSAASPRASTSKKTAAPVELRNENGHAAEESRKIFAEFVCGVVLTRRADILIPGLQVVAVQNGTTCLAAGEIICARQMKALTRGR